MRKLIAGLAATLALALGGCELAENFGALTGPDAAVAPSAGDAGAAFGMDAQGVPGADAAAPVGLDAGCVPQSLQEFCAGGGYCGVVSGTDNCGATRNNVQCGNTCSGTDVCIEAQCVHCHAAGTSCSTTPECCGNTSCKNTLCQNGCATAGKACATGADCCSSAQYCVGAFCSATCLNQGASCLLSEECCGGNCGGAAGSRTCCLAKASACSAASDCCSDAPHCVSSACSDSCGADKSGCTNPGDCCTGDTCISQHCCPTGSTWSTKQSSCVHTLVLDVSPAGAGAIAYLSGSYSAASTTLEVLVGAQVDLGAQAEQAGYAFSGWTTGPCAGTSALSCDFAMDADYTVTASFINLADAGPADASAAGLDAAGAGLDASAAGLDGSTAGLDAATAGLDATTAGLDAATAGLDAGARFDGGLCVTQDCSVTAPCCSGLYCDITGNCVSNCPVGEQATGNRCCIDCAASGRQCGSDDCGGSCGSCAPEICKVGSCSTAGSCQYDNATNSSPCGNGGTCTGGECFYQLTVQVQGPIKGMTITYSTGLVCPGFPCSALVPADDSVKLTPSFATTVAFAGCTKTATGSDPCSGASTSGASFIMDSPKTITLSYCSTSGQSCSTGTDCCSVACSAGKCTPSLALDPCNVAGDCEAGDNCQGGACCYPVNTDCDPARCCNGCDGENTFCL